MIPPEIATLIKSEAKAMGMRSLRWKAAALLALGGVVLVGGLTWSLSPAQQAAIREEAKNEPKGTATSSQDALWARHVGNLKRIGLAMVNYQSAEGHYPPAAITSKDGKPLLSWRVAILPYLEDFDGHTLGDLHKAFHLDEPWDSPHNKALLGQDAGSVFRLTD